MAFLDFYAQDPIKTDSLKIVLQNSGDDSVKYSVCHQLSLIYSTNDLKKSMEYANLSLEYAKKSKQLHFEARARISVGNVFLFQGNYEKAMDNYLLALKIAQENQLETEELISLTHLGIIKDRLNLFDEAIEYYFKALNIYNKNAEKGLAMKDVKNIQSLYNNIGNIYNSKKEYETAVKYYLKGLEISEKENDRQNIGTICNNLGKLEIERGNFDKGYVYLHKSLQTRKLINDKSGISRSYLFLGNYYKTMGNMDSALYYAQKSLEIGEEMNELMTIKNSSMMLFEIYYEMGDFKNALDYHMAFKNASDSLINHAKIEEMTRLQMQFEFEGAEKEKEAARQQTRYIYLISLTGLVLLTSIFSLLFFLSKSRNRAMKLEKEKLEEDMKIKNKELTTNVIYLIQKNELIDNITERLLRLKEHLKPENKEPVQKIIFDLQSLVNKEAWNEFEIRFQKVHERFYENLQKRFPDLSPSEIKLAAFLRLNMTSKDIASITGQNINSIETARYRLRKKLGITNQEVNLVNFLLNI
jgi:tetratricopeptide (TPR) repeat protein